ncbi:MAG: tRNA (adenosine(37)-N6)-threonylcarbamoyltransferase complex dimerization subunit type 1 TsaB [SAR202 cluster bacterium]|nr:tRNA (adenosine(37)-N6)-threonylcarbamoyltransferase complex dimerization subunit type 1 TsaB [SAR202 cluster bacterium]
MLLAIDTSTRYAGVALADQSRVLSCHCWHSTVNHTVELMPAVSQTLKSRRLRVHDLEGIAVALGPGGFSSLRVGVSAAKGLARAAGKPLVGIGTLELEAFPYLETGLPVCAWLDAGRGEVYAGWFGEGLQSPKADSVAPPEQHLENITQPTLFCGEGVTPWINMIKERLGKNGLAVAWATPAVRLAALVTLGRRKLEDGEASDLAALQPYYLRMPSIGAAKRRDQVIQQ